MSTVLQQVTIKEEESASAIVQAENWRWPGKLFSTMLTERTNKRLFFINQTGNKPLSVRKSNTTCASTKRKRHLRCIEALRQDPLCVTGELHNAKWTSVTDCRTQGCRSESVGDQEAISDNGSPRVLFHSPLIVQSRKQRKISITVYQRPRGCRQTSCLSVNSPEPSENTFIPLMRDRNKHHILTFEKPQPSNDLFF